MRMRLGYTSLVMLVSAVIVILVSSVLIGTGLNSSQVQTIEKVLHFSGIVFTMALIAHILLVLKK